MSSYPLGRAGGAGAGICGPALAPGPRTLAAGAQGRQVSPAKRGGAAVSARLRRAETKAPAAMAAGAKKGFALPPPPPGEGRGKQEGRLLLLLPLVGGVRQGEGMAPLAVELVVGFRNGGSGRDGGDLA